MFGTFRRPMLAAFPLTLVLASIALPAHAENTWRDGWCAKGEGQSVVADWGQVPDAVPDISTGKPYLVRCLQFANGAYDSTSDGRAAPFEDVGVAVTFSNGLVDSVNGINGDDHGGYWMFAGSRDTLAWDSGIWSPTPDVPFFIASLTVEWPTTYSVEPQWGTPPAPAPSEEPTPSEEPSEAPTPTPTKPAPRPSPSATRTTTPTASPSASSSRPAPTPTASRTRPAPRHTPTAPRTRAGRPTTPHPAQRPTRAPRPTPTPTNSPSPSPSLEASPSPTPSPSGSPTAQATDVAMAQLPSPSPSAVWGAEHAERAETDAPTGLPGWVLPVGIVGVLGAGGAVAYGIIRARREEGEGFDE